MLERDERGPLRHRRRPPARLGLPARRLHGPRPPAGDADDQGRRRVRPARAGRVVPRHENRRAARGRRAGHGHGRALLGHAPRVRVAAPLGRGRRRLPLRRGPRLLVRARVDGARGVEPRRGRDLARRAARDGRAGEGFSRGRREPRSG